MSRHFRLRVRCARQLVAVCLGREPFKTGSAMNEIAVLEGAGMVVGLDGSIVAVGSEEQISQDYDSASFDEVLDATNKVILPGFVDGHTHPVFAGDRVEEFAMKIAGATYLDIHKMGGGINFTVRHVHESSEEELRRSLLERLDRMLRCGTTLIEAKTGYGLVLEHEVKMLKVLHSAKALHPIEMTVNYLAAHTVPKGKTAAEATEDIVNHQIPALKVLKDKGEISPELIDVFCEKGIFELADTERILMAGQAIGLRANFHGDELSPIKAAELASKVKAQAVSHLEHVSDEGIRAMRDAGVAAVLLPTTAYVLRIAPPPARKLIDGGVIVALGSDFNPNAHCMSMPFVMNLACVTMRMTLREALVAATINSAASIGRSATHGSLEVGKTGDFVVLDAPRWEHVTYQMVDPPVVAVYKRGVAVHAQRAKRGRAE